MAIVYKATIEEALREVRRFLEAGGRAVYVRTKKSVLPYAVSCDFMRPHRVHYRSERRGRYVELPAPLCGTYGWRELTNDEAGVTCLRCRAALSRGSAT